MCSGWYPPWSSWHSMNSRSPNVRHTSNGTDLEEDLSNCFNHSTPSPVCTFLNKKLCFSSSNKSKGRLYQCSQNMERAMCTMHWWQLFLWWWESLSVLPSMSHICTRNTTKMRTNYQIFIHKLVNIFDQLFHLISRISLCHLARLRHLRTHNVRRCNCITTTSNAYYMHDKSIFKLADLKSTTKTNICART